MIARHTIPLYEGEDIFELPKHDDPRMKPWTDYLIDLGVMGEDGGCLKPCKLRRGIGPEGYLFEIEWEGL